MESTTGSFTFDSSLAMESYIEWEGSSTVGKLQKIVGKMLSGDKLELYEQTFLTDASKTKESTLGWISSFVLTPTDHLSITKIEDLREQVLTGSKSDSLTYLSQMLSGREELSPRDLIGVSQTLLDCQIESPHLANLKRFDGVVTSRDTIALALNAYNQAELPQKHRAGEVVASLIHEEDPYGIERQVTIQYSPQGKLVMTDGPVMMMDCTAYQTLDLEKVKQLKNLYLEISDSFYYNNMAILLEFAHTFRSHSEGASSKTVFDHFEPDLICLAEKYQSGTCGVLAHTFSERAKKDLGIDVITASHITENNWTILPIPGSVESPLKWNALTQEVRGFDHTDGVVFYHDENGSERAIKFACSLGTGHEEEVTDYQSIERYATMNKGYEDYPLNQGLDNSTIAKSFIKARYKAVMIKGNDKIFGVDFLKGNIYINQKWSSTMKGVPTDQNGYVSISLEALRKPESLGTYSINGENVTLSHREALVMTLSKVAGEFVIPSDMVEGLITLAQIAPKLSKELFMQPIPFIQKNYNALHRIGKELTKARSSLDEEYDHEKQNRFSGLMDVYDPLCDAIVDRKYDEAEELIGKALAILYNH